MTAISGIRNDHLSGISAGAPTSMGLTLMVDT